MKLRIKGNSLRLRISRPEMAQLLAGGRIEETIRFGAGPDAHLDYALVHEADVPELGLHYSDHCVTVTLSTAAAMHWADESQVGVYGEVTVGDEKLALVVEKDFACLGRDDAEDEDAFPNPDAGSIC